MATREATTFCRVCCVGCALKVTFDEGHHIVDIRGDKSNPMSKGYACFKGLQAEDIHHGPQRVLRPQKRQADGSFRDIPLDDALDEIAAIMRRIIDRDGPDAVATFMGSGSFVSATAYPMPESFCRAIGSPAFFSNRTVDQSAKYITNERLGGWAAGKPDLDQSDVALIFGSNPLVAHALMGFLSADPTKILKKAKERGLKLIVIDPRETETARYAALHLQPYPGEDASIAAGMLREILAHGWQDAEFCAAHIKPGGLEALRREVEPFTLDFVAARSGVPQKKIAAAAKLFATGSHKGAAWTATGVTMSPRSNLSDHMVNCLNVVCGRYRRAGDTVKNVVPWHPPFTYRAEVVPPARSWEKYPPGRIRGARFLVGEMMACNLADEITTPGKGQIKAILNGGANFAQMLPDQRKIVDALKSLELLVTIDPNMSSSAKLSHYILPVKLEFEREDMPLAHIGVSFYPEPFAAYTAAIMPTPPGSELVDDWYIYWALAKRLGVQLKYRGVGLDMQTSPTTDDLLAILCEGGQVPFEEIKKYPGGHIFDLPPGVVQARRSEANGKFDPMPDDVSTDLADVAVEQIRPGHYVSHGQIFSHRLAVRRARNVCNSQILLKNTLARKSYNPAFLHPADITAMGLRDGARVSIISDHGRIPAIVEADESVRPGVVQVTHGWGALPEENADVAEIGTCTNLLISTERDMEPINSMARLSGIPVNIEPLREHAAS